MSKSDAARYDKDSLGCDAHPPSADCLQQCVGCTKEKLSAAFSGSMKRRRKENHRTCVCCVNKGKIEEASTTLNRGGWRTCEREIWAEATFKGI
jgi:hypothetical protein